MPRGGPLSFWEKLANTEVNLCCRSSGEEEGQAGQHPTPTKRGLGRP